VLGVTGLGRTLQEAVSRAYAAVDVIHFEGGWCRRDIAHRALSGNGETGNAGS
jgi:phosphoribosylamine--glycine ligase